MWTLTENGKRLAAAIGLTIVLAVFAYFAGKHTQAQTDKEAADKARVTADSVMAVQVQAVADSVTREAMAYRPAIQKTVTRATQVSAATDTAHLMEDKARAMALAVVSDSLATVRQAKDALQNLAVQDSVLGAKWEAERSVRQRAMDLMALALVADSTALTAKDLAYQSLGVEIHDLRVQVKTLTANRPSVFGNVLRGIGTLAVGIILGHIVR